MAVAPKKPVSAAQAAAKKLAKGKSGSASADPGKKNGDNLIKETGGLTPAGTYVNPARDPKTSSFGGVNGLSRDQVNYLASGADSTYSDYVSQNALATKNHLDDNNLLRQRYNIDQGTAFRNMGFDPNTRQWNPNDQTTSYGQDTLGQNFDFGARNLTHSSEYVNAKQNLQTGYDRQVQAATTAGDRYLADLAQDDTNTSEAAKLGDTGALKDALARYAASKQKVV